MALNRLIAIVAAGGCLLTLAACGGGTKQTATPTITSAPTATATPTSSSTSNTPVATAPPTSAASLPGGGRDPVEGSLGTSSALSPGRLTNVTAATHDGYDRITFEFAGAPPTYRVEYLAEPTQCGSGEPIQPGEPVAFLQVRFTPAEAHDDQGQPTFGDTALSPRLPSITGAIQTCDFEADVTWVVILNQAADFRVTALSDPVRLAVDVAYP